MLTRALLMNPRLVSAPARVSGLYLSAGNTGGNLYNVVWDAGLARLTFTIPSSGSGYGFSIPTGVSSQAQAMASKGSGVGLYNVGSTGLSAASVTDYPAPPNYSGYSLVGVNANGDALYISGTNPPNFIIYNLKTKVKSGPFQGQAASSNTYDTGDGWVAQVAPVTGVKSGTPPYQVSGGTLTVNYPVNSAGATPLARVTTGGLSAMSMSGLPNILGGSNTVYAVTFVTIGTTDSFLRQGYAAIPVSIQIDELDIQPGDGSTVSIARALSTWTGFIQATATGCSFVPLSAYYGSRSGIVCTQTDAQTYQLTKGQSFTLTMTGQQSLLLQGLLPGVAALWRTPPATVIAGSLPGYFRAVSLRDGSTIVDTPSPNLWRNLLAIPSIGALVSWGDVGAGTQYRDTGQVAISFDLGATWKSAVVWGNSFAGNAPTRGGVDLATFRTASPLFIV